MKIFLDTNILLDSIQNRMPHAESAAMTFKLVDEGKLTASISAISISNIFYILRKQIGVGPAFEAVRQLRQMFDIVPLDAETIDRALQLGGDDLEDAIQVASSLRVAAAYLVTRNAADFEAIGFQTISATELLAIVESTSD